MYTYFSVIKIKITSFMPVRKVKYILVGAIFLILLYLLRVLFYKYTYTIEDRKVTGSLSKPEQRPVYEEQRLAEAMLTDKGTGCDIPSVDPFINNLVADADKKEFPRPKCQGPDWVQCYLSQCKVIDKILNETKNVKCTYRDLIYVTDWKSADLGDPVIVAGDSPYTLNRSDHVKVSCTGTDLRLNTTLKWSGLKVGYRNLPRPEVPKGREKHPNILLFGFDTTSRNRFIRKMPKSYKILTEKYKAVVLNKYNIVGDGTVAALFPFLAGKSVLELPELRKSFKSNSTLEDVQFIFSLLRDYGYRTAYFEDTPALGTFNYRLKGFMKQPTDHYLRAFLQAENSTIKHCSGDELRYSVMINLTRQFFKLPGHKFIFTFIVELTHDYTDRMQWADEEFGQFLMELLDNGVLKNTAVLVFGDHGPRFANFRGSYEGKVEERLPFMAIRLPDDLHTSAENVALTANRDTLTTPFDIHTTLLHLTGLQKYKNEYKIPGADMLRGNNLMEMISPNRSCAEAGVLAHWCVCLHWRHLADSDPMYYRVASTFRNYVNKLTALFRDKCALRNLKSVKWVTIKQNRNAMLAFEKSNDADCYVPTLKQNPQLMQDYYQIQVELGPSSGWYEATASYSYATEQIIFYERDVSRINAYGDEPKCIEDTSPHLAKYCYCQK